MGSLIVCGALLWVEAVDHFMTGCHMSAKPVEARADMGYNAKPGMDTELW